MTARETEIREFLIQRKKDSLSIIRERVNETDEESQVAMIHANAEIGLCETMLREYYEEE